MIWQMNNVWNIGNRCYEIEATARAYNTQAEIIADVAHNSMLEAGWQAVAERNLVW